jgi:hypothetical protein
VPRAGDDVVFRTDAQGLGSAPIVLDGATPPLNSVTFDGSWAGTLTLRADTIDQTSGQLNAHVITLDARPQAGDEVLLDAGTTVHSDVALNLAGGSIAGAGVVQAEGAINVGGTSMADPPTLGAQLIVGDGSDLTTMTFAQDSVPLVVEGDANIVVNPNASITFDTQPSGGPAAVAVIAADQAPHAMTLNGGLVQADGSSEVQVGMGVVVDSGTLEAGPAPWSLHFSGSNGYGAGLTVNGGQVIADGELSFDVGVSIAGGLVDVSDGATLQAGVDAAPVISSLSGAGDLRLEGTFRVHGDFVMTGGQLESMGSADSSIMLDSGDTFFLMGGTMYGSPAVTGGVIVEGVPPPQPLAVAPIAPAASDLAFTSGGAMAPGAAALGGQPPSGLALPPGGPSDFTSYGGPVAWTPLAPGDDPAVS